jgi:copper chaperone NosL
VNRVLTVGLGAGLTLALWACGGPTIAPPAMLIAGQESCRSCRMTISSTRTAAQVIAPNEEPLFFDDIGCLLDYVRQHRPLPPRTAVYVADRRTGSWVRAGHATYVRVAAQETPMGSHLVAFSDPSSRDLDEIGCRGRLVDQHELFDDIDVPDAES